MSCVFILFLGVLPLYIGTVKSCVFHYVFGRFCHCTGAFSIGSAFLLFLNAMRYGNITNLPSFNAKHYLQCVFLL
jgi:hypothetical protein